MDQKSLKTFYKSNQNGFTLMEIVVATTIFSLVFVALLSLFNYTLKINRKSEALRQAAQGVRNFMEFVAKEVRNGQIDYYVFKGQTYSPKINSSTTVPCGPPGNPTSAATGANTYATKENKIGIITDEGMQECIYLADANGNYVGANKFTAAEGAEKLMIEKTGITSAQVLNPANFKIDSLAFYIQPKNDPYTFTGGYAKVQPVAVIILKATLRLGTGETQDVFYQTSVSTNKYDIPNN